MSFEDYETLPTNNVIAHMTAGAFAGIMEHCIMYPMDSVKTRMQSLSPSSHTGVRGISEVFFRMVNQEGIWRPMKGMGVVVVGAGPAHAIYFSSYEAIKSSLVSRKYFNDTFSYGIAGCVSTIIHDGVMTPTDVVKQRLQMFNSPYKSILDCIKRIYVSEGLKAFYRSYTTQLMMNIPFQSIHFIAYELSTKITNPDRIYKPMAHMVSGAVAGGVAAALTTPLDVCKTLLNTQEGPYKISGIANAMKAVYRLGGPFGYFRGLRARVVYQMPSTAICWSTYEFFKYMLISSSHYDNLKLQTDKLNSKEDSFKHNPSAVSSIPEPELWVSKSGRELPAISSSHLFNNRLTFTTVHNDTVTNPNMFDFTRS